MKMDAAEKLLIKALLISSLRLILAVRSGEEKCICTAKDSKPDFSCPFNQNPSCICKDNCSKCSSDKASVLPTGVTVFTVTKISNMNPGYECQCVVITGTNPNHKSINCAAKQSNTPTTTTPTTIMTKTTNISAAAYVIPLIIVLLLVTGSIVYYLRWKRQNVKTPQPHHVFTVNTPYGNNEEPTHTDQDYEEIPDIKVRPDLVTVYTGLSLTPTAPSAAAQDDFYNTVNFSTSP